MTLNRPKAAEIDEWISAAKISARIHADFSGNPWRGYESGKSVLRRFETDTGIYLEPQQWHIATSAILYSVGL